MDTPAPRMIRIFDTTLRDGEQSPGASMNLVEKLKIAKMLAELQVDVIEAGFPIASPGDFEAVREVATQINHAKEFFPEVIDAYERVLDVVRIVYNQTVLLKGVNDT